MISWQVDAQHHDCCVKGQAWTHMDYRCEARYRRIDIDSLGTGTGGLEQWKPQADQ